MPAPRRLATPRLVGEAPAPEALAELAALFRDPQVVATLGGPRDEDQVRALLARFIRHWEESGWGPWLFRDAADGSFAGYAGLLPASALPGSVEILYALRSGLHGRGLGREMAESVLGVAFGALGLAEVVGYTLPGNRRSRGVLEATGFSLAGELVHAGHPHLLYRLPADAWRRR